MWFFQNI
jgi:hypothetical protein